MTDLTMHGAARACGKDTALHQRQSCIELVSEIGRATAVIGESRDCRQDVLVTARTTETRSSRKQPDTMEVTK